ncbi:MAG: hypothetical protein ACK5MJ_01850 [Alphaproteobacteria bacterium]
MKKVTFVISLFSLFFTTIAQGWADENNKLDKFYQNSLDNFMNLCHASDSLIYQQHKRLLLQSPYSLTYDIPQIQTTIPLTTTHIELPSLSELKASIQLTNQHNMAKCSLVINSISPIDSQRLATILEDKYINFLQNIGQDSEQNYWQLMIPNRDVTTLSLYPNERVKNATNIELARNFNILPVRVDAPLSQDDLNLYLKNEDHLAAFSLRLFSTAPFWHSWTKQVERFPIIQKTEGVSEIGDTILYLISREPSLEVRLLNGGTSHTAIMLVDMNKVDVERLISAFEKRIHLFFDYIEERPKDDGELALWRMRRSNVIQDIAIKPIADKQKLTITFYTRVVTE